MIFSVNNSNLKNISSEIVKFKGINFIKKSDPLTYKRGNVIACRLSAEQYYLEFVIHASKNLLNSFENNKLVKINEYINEEVIIGIDEVFDGSGYKYCDFYIEKIENNIFKFNIYVKEYQFLSPSYNMFIEFIINCDEI